MDGVSVAKCQNCYLRYHCDEQTEFICKSNDYCKYIMEDTMNTLDERFDFDHKYIYYIWCSEDMGGPIFGKVKIVGKLTGSYKGKQFVEYKAEHFMNVMPDTSVEYFENKYYNKWLNISSGDTVNKIYYSLNKDKIIEEFNRVYRIWADGLFEQCYKFMNKTKICNNMGKKFLEDFEKDET